MRRPTFSMRSAQQTLSHAALVCAPFLFIAYGCQLEDELRQAAVPHAIAQARVIPDGPPTIVFLDDADDDITAHPRDGRAAKHGSATAIAPSVLVVMHALSSGSNECAHGGVQSSTGIDTNGDGTLDMGEIFHTRTLCNRAPEDSIPSTSLR